MYLLKYRIDILNKESLDLNYSIVNIEYTYNLVPEELVSIKQNIVISMETFSRMKIEPRCSNTNDQPNCTTSTLSLILLITCKELKQ